LKRYPYGNKTAKGLLELAVSILPIIAGVWITFKYLFRKKWI
jgi:divalent metal cation (Fe/Co/Zn/Cd) transporter